MAKTYGEMTQAERAAWLFSDGEAPVEMAEALLRTAIRRDEPMGGMVLHATVDYDAPVGGQYVYNVGGVEIVGWRELRDTAKQLGCIAARAEGICGKRGAWLGTGIE